MKPYLNAVIAIVLAASCHHAFGEAQIRVKSNYEAGVTQHENGNFKMAIVFFEQGVSKGDPKSMFALGTHYYFGEGVDQNFPKAKSLFESSAAKGDAGANTMLGLMYQKGEGVSPDLAVAKDYFIKAAYSCNPIAQNLLAQILYHGKTGTPQRPDALAWLYLASPHSTDAAEGKSFVESQLSEDDVKVAKRLKAELETKLVCQE